MTVYIEYVLIDNFFIDYMLLKGVYLILGKTFKKKRLILSSLIGAITALIYPLFEDKLIIGIALKVLTLLLIVVVSGEFNCKKEYFITCLLFLSITFLVGGAILGIFSIFKLNYSSEFSIAVMCIPSYAVIKGVREIVGFIYSRKTVVQNMLNVELCFKGSLIKAVGFYDSGNTLSDGEYKVIFITKKLFDKILKKGLPSFSAIEFFTLSGKGKKLVFCLDYLVIYFGQERHIFNKVKACVANTKRAGVDVILHADLCKNNVEIKDYEIAKTD